MTRKLRIENLQILVSWRQTLGHLVRRKFERAVQAVVARINVVEPLTHEDQRREAVLIIEFLPPTSDRFFGVRDAARPINYEQRSAADSNVTRVLEMSGQVREEPIIVLLAILLLEQNRLIETVPGACPVLVCPYQGEREIDFGRIQQVLDRAFEDALSIERIIVEAESMDARCFGQFGLPPHDIDIAKVVEAEIAGHPRLIVTDETRLPAHEIAPLGEAATPPSVIFRDRVELREIISEDLRLTRTVARDRGIKLLPPLAFGCKFQMFSEDGFLGAR